GLVLSFMVLERQAVAGLQVQDLPGVPVVLREDQLVAPGLGNLSQSAFSSFSARAARASGGAGGAACCRNIFSTSAASEAGRARPTPLPGGPRGGGGGGARGGPAPAASESPRARS